MGTIHALKQSQRSALNTERSYLFVDKAPVIDELRTMIGDEHHAWKDVAEKSGVSYGTLYNWFMSRTLRPQAPTINAVARVFGKKLGLVNL